MRNIILILILALCASVQAEEIRYERIYPLIAGVDNRLVITLSADGELTVRRPSFMRDPGTHVFRMDNLDRQTFEHGLPALSASSEQLEQRIQNRKENEFVYIADEEITVIRTLDSDRNVTSELWARGVQPRARLFGDDRDLQRLADFEESLWQMMESYMARSGRPRA